MEAHRVRSPTLPYFRSTKPTLPVRLSVARCTHRPRVPDRRLLLPSECWEARRQVTSRFLRLNSPRRNTIGDNSSAGTSARAACHRGAKSCFGRQRYGRSYSWLIALIAAVVLVQAGLISALLRERRRRLLAEVQSRQRMAELAHVNRFSMAGELTASISHEINQPLGSILTNAETAKEILKSPTPDVAELNEIVDDILKDDQRASEVIRRMRSLLKKAPFELKHLDLNDVVRDTVAFISSLAIGRKVALITVITPDVLPILGDYIQLQQVILNLVVNGIDAMKDTPTENRIISIRTSRVEKFAELSVSDRGPGIPEDTIKRDLRTVLYQQGGRHGHGTVHRAHYYRGAPRTDMGKEPRPRRCVVSDQASF